MIRELPFQWKPVYSPEYVRQCSERIANDLNHNCHVKPIVNDYPESDLVQYEAKRRVPVVFLLTSSGRTGKDTFAKMVFEYLECNPLILSTVDMVYKTMYYMNGLLRDFLTQSTPTDIDCGILGPGKYEERKDEDFRQCLHDIKDAWTKFNNGPCIYLLKNIARATVSNATNTKRNYFQAIFINNRDLDTVQQIQYWCSQMGIVCLAVKVDGPVTSADYMNDCDSRADKIPYDIIIDNHGSLETLRLRAFHFAMDLRQSLMENEMLIPVGYNPFAVENTADNNIQNPNCKIYTYERED